MPRPPLRSSALCVSGEVWHGRRPQPGQNVHQLASEMPREPRARRCRASSVTELPVPSQCMSRHLMSCSCLSTNACVDISMGRLTGSLARDTTQYFGGWKVTVVVAASMPCPHPNRKAWNLSMNQQASGQSQLAAGLPCDTTTSKHTARKSPGRKLLCLSRLALSKCQVSYAHALWHIAFW